MGRNSSSSPSPTGAFTLASLHVLGGPPGSSLGRPLGQCILEGMGGGVDRNAHSRFLANTLGLLLGAPWQSNLSGGSLTGNSSHLLDFPGSDQVEQMGTLHIASSGVCHGWSHSLKEEWDMVPGVSLFDSSLHLSTCNRQLA